MKRGISFILILLLGISLLGCASNGGSVGVKEDDEKNIEEVVSEVQEGDFILRLVSKKFLYQPHEEEEIYAQLKYVGDANEIQISHGSSPFLFEVTEHTRDITIQPVQPLPLLYRTLEKNVWYEERFVKSGVYTEDEFVKDYFNKDGFPEGKYSIVLTAVFNTLNDKGKEEEYKISTTINFIVEEKDVIKRLNNG